MSLSTLLRPSQATDAAMGGSLLRETATFLPSLEAVRLAPDASLKLHPKQTLRVLIQLRAMLEAGVPLLAALRTRIEHAATSPRLTPRSNLQLYRPHPLAIVVKSR